jgi:cysteine-rich repeat protein
MKKCLCIIALMVFAMWVPKNASAYQTWSQDPVANTGNCATCHGDFMGGNYTSITADDGVAWGMNLMDGHSNRYVRAHHAQAGIGVCAGCHSADTTPVGEDMPSLDFSDKGIDPCDENGELLTGTGNFGDVGLDNDGDGDREPIDPDCAPAPICGDGNTDPGEECDDGNDINGDGCENDCTITPAGPVCGDGNVDAGEECDDGNTAEGDGCDSNCMIEGPPVCAEENCTDGEDNDSDTYVDCDDQDCFNDPACAAQPSCGDGNTDPGEECDDGNTDNGDGCDFNCKIETPPSDGKVTICHILGHRPRMDKRITITVSARGAERGHLRFGDTLGPCPIGDDDIDDIDDSDDSDDSDDGKKNKKRRYSRRD